MSDGMTDIKKEQSKFIEEQYTEGLITKKEYMELLQEELVPITEADKVVDTWEQDWGLELRNKTEELIIEFLYNPSSPYYEKHDKFKDHLTVFLDTFKTIPTHTKGMSESFINDAYLQ